MTGEITEEMIVIVDVDVGVDADVDPAVGVDGRCSSQFTDA
jgi:hypothetical protein